MGTLEILGVIYSAVGFIAWLGSAVSNGPPPGTVRDVVIGLFWPIWATRGIWREFWKVWRE